MTAPATFKQADVTRLIAGARKAGEKPNGIRAEPDGALFLSFGETNAKSAENPWDEELSK